MMPMRTQVASRSAHRRAAAQCTPRLTGADSPPQGSPTDAHDLAVPHARRTAVRTKYSNTPQMHAAPARSRRTAPYARGSLRAAPRSRSAPMGCGLAMYKYRAGGVAAVCPTIETTGTVRGYAHAENNSARACGAPPLTGRGPAAGAPRARARSRSALLAG